MFLHWGHKKDAAGQLVKPKSMQEMYKISFFPDGENVKEVKKSNGNLRRVADNNVLESTKNHKFLRCKQSKAPAARADRLVGPI